MEADRLPGSRKSIVFLYKVLRSLTIGSKSYFLFYIESTEDIEASETLVKESNSEESDDGFEERGLSADDIQRKARESSQAIEGTIRTYTTHTLSAFKNLPDVNIDKVTLKFGVEIGGEAGIPYITKGTAKSNLNIEVECSFPKKDTSSTGN